MQERAQGCAALQHGGTWDTGGRGFSISDLAWQIFIFEQKHGKWKEVGHRFKKIK